MVDRSVIKSKLTTAESRLNELKAFRSVAWHVFKNDTTVQAAILHHLQVAIQACIDTASHIVADQGWGVPGSSKDLFGVLAQRRVISWPLSDRLKDLVAARNLIVHGYDKLDLRKVHRSLPDGRRAIALFLKASATYAKL